MNRILSCREWNSNSLGTNERNESAIETGFAILSGGGVSLIRIGTKEMSGRVLLRLVKNFRESLRPKCFFFFFAYRAGNRWWQRGTGPRNVTAH